MPNKKYKKGDRILVRPHSQVDFGTYFHNTHGTEKAEIVDIIEGVSLEGNLIFSIIYVSFLWSDLTGRINATDIQGLDTVTMMKEGKSGN